MMKSIALFLCISMIGAGCCHTQTHSAYRSIHQAAIDGDAVSVSADLKAHPGDLNLPDDAGQTPLHLAAIHCRTNVVALLLDKGARPDALATGDATPLHLAAQAGCAEAVTLLLSKGASINLRDSQGRTPLGRAKQWRQDATAELLRARGGIE